MTEALSKGEDHLALLEELSKSTNCQQGRHVCDGAVASALDFYAAVCPANRLSQVRAVVVAKGDRFRYTLEFSGNQ